MGKLPTLQQVRGETDIAGPGDGDLGAHAARFMVVGSSDGCAGCRWRFIASPWGRSGDVRRLRLDSGHARRFMSSK